MTEFLTMLLIVAFLALGVIMIIGWCSIQLAERRILCALHDKPGMFGRDLADVAEVSRGQIYVRLADLEERGLVRSKLIGSTDSDPFLPRRRYYLTADGVLRVIGGAA